MSSPGTLHTFQDKSRAEFNVANYMEGYAGVWQRFSSVLEMLPAAPVIYRYDRDRQPSVVGFGGSLNLSLSKRASLVSNLIGADAQVRRSIGRWMPGLTAGGGVGFGDDGEVLGHASLEIGLPRVFELGLRAWQRSLTVSGTNPIITIEPKLKLEMRDSTKLSDTYSPIDSSTSISGEIAINLGSGRPLVTVAVEQVYSSRTINIPVDGVIKTVVVEKSQLLIKSDQAVLTAAGISLLDPRRLREDQWFVYEMGTRRPVAYAKNEGRILVGGDQDIADTIAAVAKMNGGSIAEVNNLGDLVITGKRLVPDAKVFATTDGVSINRDTSRMRGIDSTTGETIVVFGARTNVEASGVVRQDASGKRTVDLTLPETAPGRGDEQRLQGELRSDGFYVNGVKQAKQLGDVVGALVDYQLSDIADDSGKVPNIYNTGTGIGYTIPDGAKTRRIEMDIAGGRVTRVRQSADDEKIEVQQTVDLAGKPVSTEIRVKNNPVGVDFSDAGGLIGSQLGTYLAKGDVLTGIIASGALRTIGNNLGDTLDSVVGGKSIGEAAGKAFNTFPQELVTNIAAAGVGAASSYITAQLINALGVNGFAGELANSAGGAAINTVISNIVGLNGPVSPFHGVSAALPTAVASFLGTKLANEIYKFETVGGQIGSAVGAGLSALRNSKALVAALKTFNPKIIAAVVVFIAIDALLGGLIGSIFGGTPRSGADVIWDPEQGRFTAVNAYARWVDPVRRPCRWPTRRRTRSTPSSKQRAVALPILWRFRPETTACANPTMFIDLSLRGTRRRLRNATPARPEPSAS